MSYDKLLGLLRTLQEAKGICLKSPDIWSLFLKKKSKIIEILFSGLDNIDNQEITFSILSLIRSTFLIQSSKTL